MRDGVTAAVAAVAAVAVAGGGGGPGEMWVELGAADAALPTPVDPAELLRARIRRREDGAGMRLGPGRALGTEEDRICACKPLSKQGTAQRRIGQQKIIFAAFMYELSIHLGFVCSRPHFGPSRYLVSPVDPPTMSSPRTKLLGDGQKSVGFADDVGGGGGGGGGANAAQQGSGKDRILTYGSRWLMLALFCAATMTNAIIWITFAPISAQASVFFDASTFAVNGLSMVFMVMYLPGTLLSSYLLERCVRDACPHTLRHGLPVRSLGLASLTSLTT